MTETERSLLVSGGDEAIDPNFREDLSMPITYRLVNYQDDWLADAHSIGYLKGLVAKLAPGRYSVDENRDEPGLGGHLTRRWGTLIKLDDGTIIAKLGPWEA